MLLVAWLALLRPLTASAVTVIEPHQVKEAEGQFRTQADKIRRLQVTVGEMAVRLATQASSLQERASRLEQAAARCRARLASQGPDHLDVCTVTTRRQTELSVREAEALATEIRNTAAVCQSFARQTDTGKRALQTQLDVVERGLRELQEWATTNNQAQWDALKDGTVFVMGRLADWLMKEAASARALQGWVTRYQRQLSQRGIAVDAIRPKLEETYRRYLNAAATASEGKLVMAGIDVDKAWEVFKNSFSATVEMKARSDAEIRGILHDPGIQRFINDDHPINDLGSSFVETGSEEALPFLVRDARVVPVVNFAAFIIDFGYDASRFEQSWEQIIRQYDLAEISRRAVGSLSNYLDHRETAFARCFRQF